MPRYHFDIEENGTALHDEDGEVCGSPQEAETKARNFAVEMIRHGFNGETKSDAPSKFGKTVESRLPVCWLWQKSISSA